MKSVAVITDATSPDFYFPRWKNYYGKLFGLESLHVVTYAGLKPLFADMGLRNVWELNCVYNDRIRANFVSDLIAALLNTYDVVLRCDVDEMLVPDPARYADLASFVQQNELAYVTAHGIDVVELRENPILVANLPILGRQRRYGIRVSAGSKTCLVTTPLRWAAGFHAANVFPRFAGLYNFHLKFADLKSRIAWHSHMAGPLDQNTPEHKYFNTGAEDLTALLDFISNKSKLPTENESDFDRRFLDSVTYNKIDDIYGGDFLSQEFLIRIDQKFNEIV